MNILVYSFNDKIGDGLQKITFLQKLKDIYPNSLIYYTTSQTTTLKDKLNPLVKDISIILLNITILNLPFFVYLKKVISFKKLSLI